MKIGDKVRTLRTELKMTQKELAGEEITRNMLSCIENGSALPSLQTLLYLANRLGVSAGFLIAEENEDFIYRKSTEIIKIRQAYARADWKLCLRYCELQNSKDSEIQRYALRCRFNLARDCFNCGELRQAGVRFNEVSRECEVGFELLYPDGFLNRVMYGECMVYLKCLSDISPAFSVGNSASGKDMTNLLSDPFTVYYSFYSEPGDSLKESETLNYINSRPEDESYFTGHIKARSLMNSSKYREAADILKEIAYGEQIIPQPVLLFLLNDLEICFRELSDFRSAYESAGLHRDLLDSFLSDKI